MSKDDPIYIAISQYFLESVCRAHMASESYFQVALRPDHTEQEFINAALGMFRLKLTEKIRDDIFSILSSNAD